MAVSFTNNFKNILDKLRNILRTEFKGALPVYIGHESEQREFTLNIYYYFLDKNIKKTSLDHVLRYVSRIEALIHDNTSTTLSDSANLYNCRVESTSLNALEDENEYVVELVWKGQHTGNIS